MPREIPVTLQDGRPARLIRRAKWLTATDPTTGRLRCNHISTDPCGACVHDPIDLFELVTDDQEPPR